MIRNFISKKGDQISFMITFLDDVSFSTMELGIKKDYCDEDFLIFKSLNRIDRKVVFIGDSYAEGYTPDGRVTGWPNVVVNILDLKNSIINYKGGTGFISGLQNGSFTDLLNQIPSDGGVTDIIVAGGYNDRYGTRKQILDGIKLFCDTARVKFPNANIKIGMIGWSSIERQQQSLKDAIVGYKQGCEENGVTYMERAENSIHNDLYFSSDNIHPNQTGENIIAENISTYISTYYGGGITRIDNRHYQIVIPSSETEILDYDMYVYDLRVRNGNVVKTPLSGKIIIRETVFNG